jgi:hypothetical protein
MFEVREGISVAEAVAKAKARQTESAKPTVSDAVAQDVSDEGTQEPLEQEQETDYSEESSSNSEESGELENEQEETNDDDSDLFYDIDGEEVSASQIIKWKSGSMKDADYTRKTQDLAKRSKDFEKLETDFKTKQAQLDSAMAEVEAIIAESSVDEETLKDWREYDPEKYIEYKEKKEARDKLLANSKTTKSSNSNSSYEKEYTAFAQSNTDWFDNGEPTEKAKQDIKVMTAYADANGFTNDDLTGLKSHHFKMLLDAAKYNSARSSNAAVTKKVRKAPAITKPRQGFKSSAQQELKAAQEKFNRSGTIADGVALRKLKSKLNS